MLNLVPRHEDVSGSGGIAPRILNLCNGWKWVVSFKLWPLYPRCKSHRYPLERRLGRAQNRNWRSGEEKKILIIASAGNWIPVVQPVA